MRTIWNLDKAVALLSPLLSQTLPDFADASTTSWEHTVLETVKISTMNRRHKLACSKVEGNSRGKIMLA